MSVRISATISDECCEALKKLMSVEHRTFSNLVAALLERSIPELCQEWQDTGAVKTLKKKNTRRYDAEIENMPFDAA